MQNKSLVLYQQNYYLILNLSFLSLEPEQQPLPQVQVVDTVCKVLVNSLYDINA